MLCAFSMRTAPSLYFSVLYYFYLLTWRSTIAIFKIPAKSSGVQIAHSGLPSLTGVSSSASSREPSIGRLRALGGQRTPFAMNSEDCYRYCAFSRSDFCLKHFLTTAYLQLQILQAHICILFYNCPEALHIAFEFLFIPMILVLHLPV